MDSRDIPPPPSQHQQPPPGMLMSHYRNPNPLMGPTSTSQSIHHRLPFGSLAPQQQQPSPPQTLHHQQQMDQKTLESLGFGDGSSPSSQSMRFGIEQQSQSQSQNQQVKKKRGRPRKYTPDGNIALGLAPASPLLSAASNSYGGGDGVVGDSGGGGGNSNSADPPAKRNRGRPPGSSKKPLDALGATVGIGFTPHVIEVKTGEDIAAKVMAFSEQGPRTVCIISASGPVSRVTIRQDSRPSGTITYEGRFEIINLSGSFSNSEVNGGTNRSGSLSVALAGSDGRIVGGIVVGPLVAASQVQVIVGSFVAEQRKPKQSSGNNARGPKPEPASTPVANMLNFGSNSQGPSSESSEENESGSPSMQHRDNNNNNGMYGNSVAQQQQQLRQMQMYHQLWPNHGQ